MVENFDTGLVDNKHSSWLLLFREEYCGERERELGGGRIKEVSSWKLTEIPQE